MINVISYEDAVKALSRAFGGAIGTISLPVTECAGFIAAEDVYAPEDVPPFDRSVVDGYAASYRDTSAASPSVPSILILKGESRMGEATGEVLSSGECFYVPTGGMLPAGADAVLMIEDSEKVNDEIYFSRTLHKGENVIFKGADVAKGDVVLKKGERLGAAVIGALCSMGIATVKVYRKLDYFVISTGDELVPANAECPIGKIRDTNTAILAAELSETGNVVGTALVSDDYEALSRSMRAALDVADVVVVSGGSSVGKADYTAKLFREFGEPLFGGVAVKPGKPTLAAKAGKKLLVGLPGHSMAAFSSCRLILRRALLNACGSDLPAPVVCRALRNFPGGKGRTAVVPVKLKNLPEYTGAEPLFYQSGMLSVISSADGFALLADHVEGVDKGAPLEVYIL